MKLKIAVVQQGHRPGCLAENRARAYEAAQKALAQGADVILFHEEMTMGYTPLAPRLAEAADGETTQGFARLLRGSESCVVYGLTERTGGKLYISAPVVTAGGLQANYRKTHLYTQGAPLRQEQRLFTPGDRLVAFSHRGVKIGLMICYDGDFPPVVEAYRRAGCTVVLWLNNRESRGNGDLVREHARRNSMILAVSCCCGPDETGRLCRGGSNITDYDGKALAEIWDDEGIICAEVDPDAALAAREENHWLQDRRDDLYGKPL